MATSYEGGQFQNEWNSEIDKVSGGAMQLHDWRSGCQMNPIGLPTVLRWLAVSLQLTKIQESVPLPF